MIILPQIIDRIMATAFYPEGVIRLNRLEESDFGEIPVLRQVFCLCLLIREENGKLKLTNTGNLPLNDLHYLIQYAMGWENAHLHEFEKEGVCYTDNVDEELPSVQYDGIVISDLLKDKGDTVLYRYDFGDNWEHIIELEELLTRRENMDYRVLMDGGRRCPPEDCGGVYGYHRMLEVLNDPDDPEREEYLVWLGGPYDPDERLCKRSDATSHKKILIIKRI